jgi:imidazolonepropionase-like amidohydrolase
MNRLVRRITGSSFLFVAATLSLSLFAADAPATPPAAKTEMGTSDPPAPTAPAADENQSPVPPLPADIPKDAVISLVLSDKKPAGQDAVWTTPDGVVHEFFQFNDRGRGPKTYSNYHLDKNAIVVAEDTAGVDYMKSPVDEKFALESGTAKWKNQSENVTLPGASGKYYIDLNGGPQSGTLLARALLRAKGESLPTLPGGSAHIRKLQSLPVEANGKKVTASLYEITGLSFSPNYLWLDEKQEFFAAVQGWSGLLREGFEPALSQLVPAQQKVESERWAELALKFTHKPSGDLVIKNVALFDAPNAAVVPSQRVTVRGDRIAAVEAENGQPVAKGVTVIDGSGQTLLPGLWDMHQHIFPENAFLDIASGITTARDLANNADELKLLRDHIAAGEQIGPRIIRAGFIDGPGPFEGPVKVLAATPEEAIKEVDHYADLGYVQIKIYSSVKPELVPVIIEEAHKKGMRVSGHVPAGMIAQQFIEDGADEIQHMNFVFLNFMPDVKETRTPARFIEPGKRGAALDLDSPQVNDFIALLKTHHTVIDPTMAIWEATFVDRPGQVAVADHVMFDRLPVQVQRGSKTASQALDASDPATDKLYRASYANMVRMVKKLYDSGVQLVAGTDQNDGYALDRELEIYNLAGIPAARVLRMATLEAAQVMHEDKDFGSIAPGKVADVILVRGNPAANISDIWHVETVVKNGTVYRPAELYPALGIKGE